MPLLGLAFPLPFSVLACVSRCTFKSRPTAVGVLVVASCWSQLGSSGRKPSFTAAPHRWSSEFIGGEYPSVTLGYLPIHAYFNIVQTRPRDVDAVQHRFHCIAPNHGVCARLAAQTFEHAIPRQAAVLDADTLVLDKRSKLLQLVIGEPSQFCILEG